MILISIVAEITIIHIHILGTLQVQVGFRFGTGSRPSRKGISAFPVAGRVASFFSFSLIKKELGAGPRASSKGR